MILDHEMPLIYLSSQNYVLYYIPLSISSGLSTRKIGGDLQKSTIGGSSSGNDIMI